MTKSQHTNDWGHFCDNIYGMEVEYDHQNVKDSDEDDSDGDKFVDLC